MRKPFPLALIAAFFVANLLLFAPRSLGLHGGVLGQLDLLVDVRYELMSGYVEAPDAESLIQAAVNGMIQSLNDPYTVYLTPKDMAAFDRDTTGRFTGIGAEVTIDPISRRLQVVTPLEDSPAWKAGVLAGDLILEINGESTQDMPINTAVEKLIGPKGTNVTVLIRRETGEEVTITITRDEINVQTVRGFRRDADHHYDYMIDPIHGIGYIRLTQFIDKTAPDLRAVVNDLQKKGLKALILDLRFNPGGLLDSAVTISDMFLPEGKTIVSIKGRSMPDDKHTSTAAETIRDVPMVVLANEASASAAEIVAGALSDNDRAQFIGMRTFGKGSVQQVKMLDRGQGALKMTNAYYYIPSGRKIHRVKDSDTWGVEPKDGFFVPMTPPEIEKMMKTRRQNDVMRQGNGVNFPQSLTPEYVENELLDKQLAAGLRAMVGRLETGQWPVVGQPGGELLARQAKERGLEQQRNLLRERLDQVEQELAKLHGEDQPQAIAPSPSPDPMTPAEPAPTEGASSDENKQLEPATP